MPAQGPGDESEQEVAGRGVGEDLGGMVTALAATTRQLGPFPGLSVLGQEPGRAGAVGWACPAQTGPGARLLCPSTESLRAC